MIEKMKPDFVSDPLKPASPAHGEKTPANSCSFLRTLVSPTG